MMCTRDGWSMQIMTSIRMVWCRVDGDCYQRRFYILAGSGTEVAKVRELPSGLGKSKKHMMPLLRSISGESRVKSETHICWFQRDEASEREQEERLLIADNEVAYNGVISRRPCCHYRNRATVCTIPRHFTFKGWGRSWRSMFRRERRAELRHSLSSGNITVFDFSVR
jgi:hypothetical protein